MDIIHKYVFYSFWRLLEPEICNVKKGETLFQSVIPLRNNIVSMITRNNKFVLKQTRRYITQTINTITLNNNIARLFYTELIFHRHLNFFPLK